MKANAGWSKHLCTPDDYNTQKVTRNVQSVPRQSPDIYWHAELCSVIPNSKYVIMVGNCKCLKYCIYA